MFRRKISPPASKSKIELSKKPAGICTRCSSETSVDFYQTTCHYIPGSRTLHRQTCDNLKFRGLKSIRILSYDLNQDLPSSFIHSVFSYHILSYEYFISLSVLYVFSISYLLYLFTLITFCEEGFFNVVLYNFFVSS
jgi:hypothetical protein